MQKGLITTPEKNLLIEEVHDGSGHSGDRFKRSSEEESLIMIYESEAGGGECGIKPWNVKRMKSPRKKAVLLDNGDDDEVAAATERSARTIEFEDLEREMEAGDEDVEDFGSSSSSSSSFRRSVSNHQDLGPKRVVHYNKGSFRGHVRRKRQASDSDKAIELAVFVDDVVYDNERSARNRDPIAAIQAVVFTYLNSVSKIHWRRVDGNKLIVLCFHRSSCSTTPASSTSSSA